MLLGKAFEPTPAQNRMRNHGDVAEARRVYDQGPSNNLAALLDHRYRWLRPLVDPHWVGLELASGIAVTKDFLSVRSLTLTDFGEGDWLDREHVDALATPFEDEAFDFVLIQNAIHHLPRPIALFPEVARILRPGGLLFIRDVKCSLVLRAITRVTRVEGYRYEVDVYDPENVICDPTDPWASNNAVPDLLFDDIDRFHAHVPQFRVEHQHLDECLLFLVSGGVTNKTFTLPLPPAALRAVAGFDRMMTRQFPEVFAMQRSLVLRKSS